MVSEAGYRIGSALVERATLGVDSGALADEIVRLLEQIEAILTPILGRRGMAVIFRRTLALTSATVPWLAIVNQQSDTELPFDAVRAACAAQQPSIVAEGGASFFKAFYELLSSLIGASLTAQLLSTVSVAPHNESSRTPGHEQ